MNPEDEQLVTKFASLLSNKRPDARFLTTSSSSRSASSWSSRELLACFSKQIQNHDVVCTVPSLDARKIDDDSGESILPKVGEHHMKMDVTPDGAGDNAPASNAAAASAAPTATATGAIAPGGQETPSVAAGADPKPSPASLPGASAPTSAPGESAKKPASGEAKDDEQIPQMEASFITTVANARTRAAQVDKSAAQNLGSLTSWTKSSLLYASDAIANNVSESFSYLIDSRVQTWTVLLLRHSVTSENPTDRSNLLRMLFSTIKLESTTTNFKALSLPESAKEKPKEADVILPLLLEVKIGLSIQDKTETVSLRAPGTIAANTNRSQGANPVALTKVDIRLDAGALLTSMIQQARLVVLKAVEKAIALKESSGKSESSDPMGSISSRLGSSKSSSALSSGFSSSLKLSSPLGSTLGSKVPSGPHEPNHRLAKAKPSALRLKAAMQAGAAGNKEGGNNAQMGAAALDKIRKTRSIQWEHGIIPKIKGPSLPTAKRQRVAQTTAQLASFKSFGRPHAGDFGSGPRNATFGDFGSHKPIWGRTGRLMNHPKPMQAQEDQNGEWATSAKKNATFDNLGKPSRPRIHLMQSGDFSRSSSGGGKSASKLGLSSSSSLGLASAKMSSHGSQSGGLGRIPSSLPRTATAMEGFLLQGIHSQIAKGL